MRSMRRRTLRGQLTGNEVRRLIIDDGKFTHGHRVTEFYVFPATAADWRDGLVVLCLDDDAHTSANADDNREIGWSIFNTTGRTSSTILSPEHIAVQDLFIQSVGTTTFNYVVVIEPISMTESQGILQLIKERSQDDLN